MNKIIPGFRMVHVLFILFAACIFSCSHTGKSISYHLEKPATLDYNEMRHYPLNRASHEDSLLAKLMDSLTLKMKNYRFVTGIIWNSGDQPIQSDDLAKELTLTIPTTEQIISFNTVQLPDSIKAAFNFIPVKGRGVTLRWKNFAPHYAVKFMFVYYRNSDSSPTITARFKNKGTIKQVNDINKPNLWVLLIEVALATISFFTFFISYRLEFSSLKRKRFSMLMSIASLAAITYFVADFVVAANTYVPFASDATAEWLNTYLFK